MGKLKTSKILWNMKRVRFIVGGSTRHRSIHNGIKNAMKADPNVDVIIIHDAVRPFVDEITLKVVASAGYKNGAAGTILPLVSTDENGFLKESLDRSKYRASQTPQAFQPKIIDAAYSKCCDHDLDHGTECLALCLNHCSVRAKLIDGPTSLWKVTYRHDLFTAEQIIKQGHHRVAIVTGGTRGIGLHVAQNLVDRGLKVAVIARTKHQVETISDQLGFFGVVADLSCSHEVEKAFHTVFNRFGTIDVVVNCAGVAVVSSIAETSDADWQYMVQGNLSTTFYCCREAIKYMRAARGVGDRAEDISRSSKQISHRGGGVIVNVGSSSTQGGRVDQGAYAASKAAIQLLTETLSLEGKEEGIHAFCVVPRRTDTTMREKMFPGKQEGSLLEPQEVARIIISVIFEANPCLSGMIYNVDSAGSG
eukprot:UC4_evm2s574